MANCRDFIKVKSTNSYFTSMRLNHKILLSLAFVVVLFSSVSTHSVKAYPQVEWQVQLFTGLQSINAHPYQDHIIFSEPYGLYYAFYYNSNAEAGQGALEYSIIDIDGNILTTQTFISNNPTNYASIEDFSLVINKDGYRVYLVVAVEAGDSALDTMKDTLRCMYILYNPSSGLLDVVNEASPDTFNNYQTRWVDITVVSDGYQVITSGTDNGFKSQILISNSTTAWVSADIEISPETIMLNEVGKNPNNLYAHIMSVSPLEDNGFAVFYRVHDWGNHRLEFQAIIVCDNLTLAGISGYTGGNFDVEDYIVPMNVHGTSSLAYNYFDIVNRDNDEVWYVYGRVVADQKILVGRYNRTSDTLNTYEVWNNATFIQADFTSQFIAINERDAVNVVFAKDGDVNRWNVTKWNGAGFDAPTLLFDTLTQMTFLNELTSTQNFVPFYDYGNATIQGIITEGSLSWAWHFLDAGYTYYPPMLNITLDDNVDNTLEEYGVLITPSTVHTVETNVHDNVTMFYASFEDLRHTVEFMYNLTSNVGYTTIKAKDSGSILNVAYINDVRETSFPINYTNLELDFIFTEDCFDFYSQLMGYGYFYNGAWTNTSVSNLKYSIFNEGGIPVYSGGGDNTIYDDNDIFSIGATNDTSWIQFSLLYDKLQHMHFEVEFDINGDWEPVGALFENLTGGFFEYGINYWFEGEYREGWKVRIYPSSFKVGHQNAGSDFDWVQWTVEHYFFNITLDDYQLGETEILYSNFNGYDEASSTPDYHNRTSATWWVDMWFSNDNASQKVASRVNTEWYGMYEQGVAWWFGYGGFRPMQGDLPESIYYNNVYNNNGSIETVRDSVDIVEFWGRVEKITGGDREYIMHNYLMKNKVLAQGDMLGIDTPALVETKVMDMPQQGFLSPLLKVLSDIQRMIWQGIINVIMGLGGLVDTILVAIGLPPLMSVFFNILTGIYEVFSAIYISFISVIDWMVESIQGMIASIFILIPRYMLFIGLFLQTFVSYYEGFVLFFTGGFGDMNNFWVDYSVMEILELYLIAILPFSVIARIEGSDNPMKALIEEAEGFMKIVMGVFNLAKTFMDMAINIIKAIIGVI